MNRINDKIAAIIAAIWILIFLCLVLFTCGRG